MSDRIIVLVDMDCFYCQVENRYNPSLKGKPMAVVQYNEWQGGGIIAVNYEARAFGVTRHIRGNEAKKKCPEIVLVHVPSVRGKADLTRYRDAGREVVDVLCRFCDTVQRASVDEAYLDITQAVDKRFKELKGTPVKVEELVNTYVVGCSPEDSNDEDERKKSVIMWLNKIYHSELHDETAEKLAVAGCLVEEMRAAVYESTGFRCSAGIAHNKILAKLACGLHKPQRQTILPRSGVPILYHNLPLKKVRGLGGKFGDLITQRLNVTFMGELQQFSETYLQKTFDEKSGSWLFNIARGLDDESVTTRLTSKSIGCCKKFPGKLALGTKESVEHWLGELSEEVSERLEKELLEGNRKATQFVVSYMQTVDGRNVSSSRCGTLSSLDPKQIVLDSMDLLKRSNMAPAGSTSWYPPLKFLGLSAGKFVDKNSGNKTIQNFFKSAPKQNDASHIESIRCSNDTSIPALTESPKTPEYANKDENKSKSSGKKSFFVKFFKQEGLIRTPSSSKMDKISLENHENAVETNSERELKREPTGTSQQATTSEGYKGITNQTLRFLQVDESSNDSNKAVEHWVSPGEIFPDLDEVDDDVAALLPSPIQRQLQTRVQRHREAKNAKRNKGCGKGKSKKCLTYDKSEELKDETVLDDTKTSEHLLEGSDGNTFLYKSDCDVVHISENEEGIKSISQVDIFASDSTPEHATVNTSDNVQETSLETSDIQDRMCNISNNTCESANQRKEINYEKECDFQEQNAHSGAEDIDHETVSNDSSRENIFQVSDVLKEVCPHCNQLVSLQEYPEHLDFHVAFDLDKEINRMPTSRSTAYKSNTVPTENSPKKDVQGKRKRGKVGQKHTAPTTDKKMRSITTFFAPVR